MTVISTWTAREDQQLRLAYPTTKTAILAERLGRTKDAIWARAKRIGVTKLRRKKQFESAWTAREDRQLRLAYPTTDNDILAERFGRTTNAIRVRAKRLGVTKEAERRPWTVEEEQFVMTAAGSLSQKARTLGRSRSSISTKQFFLRQTRVAT